MHVRCPHCHNAIEIVEEASLRDVDCPSCGSSFSLLADHETRPSRPGNSQTIGHFELVEAVGLGAFGRVYRARDHQLDRQVAIKIPRKDQLSAEEAELFLREARAAAQLKHPNIVSVHEVGREDGTVYIVSDFVDGYTLADRLTSGPVSIREAVELCVKIAEALHHAHEHGVIHRDLKPGNIMLDHQGQPHVMDFGLAKRDAGEITMTIEGRILGTPAYMSPEQAKGEARHVDRRTDVYSLGVILFELMTGELPFRGNQRMLLHQVIHDEPPSPGKLNSSVPRDLETISLKCLRKEPGRRYDDAQEVAADLAHFLAGEPIVARPITQIERGWRWCRRKPVVAGLSALLVLALVSGTAVSMFFAIQSSNRADQLAASNRLSEERADEAEARFELALDAIEKYYTGVSEEVMLKRPELEELRKRLLESALGFYSDLKEDLANVSEERQLFALARAQFALAALTRQVGSPQAAIEGFQNAIDVYQQLVAVNPDVANYQDGLAASFLGVGAMQNSASDLIGAKTSFQQGINIIEKLVEDHPGSKYQYWLAGAYYNFGSALWDNREYSDSESFVRRSIAMHEKLVEAESAADDYQNGLARGLRILGRLQQADGNLAGAVESFKRSIEIRDKLIATSPMVSEYLLGQSLGYGELGVLQTETGDHDAALESRQEAIEILEKLVAANPNVADYQNRLANGYVGLSITQRRKNDLAGAEQSLRLSIKNLERLVASNPGMGKYLAGLAGGYINLGTLQRANNDLSDAENSLQQAIDNYQKLIAANPDVEKYQLSLANTYGNLGVTQQLNHKLSEATTSCRQAISTFKKLIDEYPKISEFKDGFARSSIFLGILQQKTGDYSGAEESFRQSIEVLNPLVENNSTSPFRVNLVRSYWERAKMFDQMKRFAEAADDWGRAAGLETGSNKGFFRMGRMISLVRNGNTDALADFVKQTDEDSNISASELIGIARELLTNKDGRCRNEKAALRYALRACTLEEESTSENLLPCLDTLSLAQLKNGLFREALTTTWHSLELQFENASEETRQELQQRLEQITNDPKNRDNSPTTPKK